MAIRVQTEFVRKGTVRIICYVYDDDEALVAATSVSISIISPSGAVAANGVAMSTSETGIYEYYYTTAASHTEGNWQIECDILDGSYHTFVHSHFNLRAGINE